MSDILHRWFRNSVSHRENAARRLCVRTGVVSRVFAPRVGVEEDPVTGSTHCMITPYWCKKLGKNHLSCFQASARTGKLYTGIDGDRVTIAGKAVFYSVGEILPEGINSSLPNANG